MLRTIPFLLCLGVLLLGTSAHLQAQLPIFDDFEGDSSVIWNPKFGGTRRVVDGDYIVSDTDFASSWISGTGDLSDVSVRSRLRILEGDSAGIFARSPEGKAYWGAVHSSGRIRLEEIIGGDKSRYGRTEVDPVSKDALLQLDVFGDEMSLTVWAEGAEKPNSPQLTFNDDSIKSGWIGLFMSGGGTVAYRWFQAVASDFDCNGDALLNEDDLACVTTIEDRDDVLEALQTLPGDLDGDGKVAFSDFLVLSTNFNQDLPSYTAGNIDLKDGVGFEDFLILSGNFGKLPSTVAAVPEPNAALLGILFGLIVVRVRRRFRSACSFATTGGE